MTQYPLHLFNIQDVLKTWSATNNYSKFAGNSFYVPALAVAKTISPGVKWLAMEPYIIFYPRDNGELIGNWYAQNTTQETWYRIYLTPGRICTVEAGRASQTKYLLDSTNIEGVVFGV